MHAVRVTYTVNEDYVATNEGMICAVMSELAELGDCGVKYSAFRIDRTFMHLVVMADKDKSGIIPGLVAFARFQAGLKGNLQAPPKAEELTVVGASFAV